MTSMSSNKLFFLKKRKHKETMDMKINFTLQFIRVQKQEDWP